MNKLQKYIETHLNETSKSDCFMIGAVIGFIICTVVVLFGVLVSS